MDLYWIEGLPAGRLAVATRPRGGDWLEDDLRAARDAGIEVLVSMLTREEETELGLGEEMSVANAVGLEFVGLPVPDYSVPAFEAVAPTFGSLAAAIRRGRSVAIHCRIGIGRSSLAVASILTLLGDAPSKAWSRVEAARGVPVPDTEAQRQWVHDFFRLSAG
jgi:protein-tyrosine phosphatase